MKTSSQTLCPIGLKKKPHTHTHKNNMLGFDLGLNLQHLHSNGGCGFANWLISARISDQNICDDRRERQVTDSVVADAKRFLLEHSRTHTHNSRSRRVFGFSLQLQQMLALTWVRRFCLISAVHARRTTKKSVIQTTLKEIMNHRLCDRATSAILLNWKTQHVTQGGCDVIPTTASGK